MRVRPLILSLLLLLTLLALAGAPRPRARWDDSGEPTPPWECTIIAGGLACISGETDATPTPTPTPAWECTIVAGELACIEVPPRRIEGQIRRRSDGAAIAGVEVMLEGPDGARVTQTDLDGRYVFEVGGDGPFTIVPRGATDLAPAVSSLDAAYVAQSVLGARQLASEQALACDVTGNGRLSSLDAAFIVRHVVGLTPELPLARKCGSDWLFFPVAEEVPGQTVVEPQVDGSCRNGALVLDSVDDEAAGQDFEAVGIGDCSAPPLAAQRFRARSSASTAEPVVVTGRLRRSTGGRLVLPVFVRSAEPVYALDAKFFFDPSLLRATRARLNGQSSGVYYAFNGAYAPGIAALALASASSLPLDADGAFSLSVLFEPVDRSHPPPTVSIGDALVDERPVAIP